ncbi:MAG TPA: DUF2059 domain-containing protein [Thermoanaerobaculia bacterium]|nr:DUF2059 domain-containing protein [Thermoanaerobaculia bacterium]
MRIALRRLLPLLLVAVLIAPAANGLSPATPPAKEAKIRRFLQLTGSAQLGTQVVNQLMESFKTAMPQVPAAFWSDFQKEIRPDDFVNLVIPIYARHFSESDLDGLIAFYSSPLGQKVTHEMPAVTSECVVTGQEWGRKLSNQILARAKQKGYLPRS